jgi:hypothetical protein
MRSKNVIAACFVGAALCATGAFAQQEGAVLGTTGELYIVKSGMYGQLFQGVPKEVRLYPVLALEIVRPGGFIERLLVPGSGGAESERSPELAYEEASHTVYLSWESQPNKIHAVLMLAGFDGRSWTEPIQVSGNPFIPKSSPHLLATRDSYQEKTAEGGLTTRYRTVLHLLWGEETDASGYETLYSPIILENGEFVGVNPIYLLASFDPRDEPATSFEASLDLVRQPVIQPGLDGRTVVVAFASPVTRRMVSVEIDVLPQQLGILADDARVHIIDMGSRLKLPAQLKDLADSARANVLANGVAFYPEIAESLANRVQTEILAGGASGDNDLRRIADQARVHIIDMGAQLSGRGLRRFTGASLANKIVGVSASAATDESDSAGHLLQFRVASSRPAPQVGAGSIRTFVSEDGRDVLVAWPDKERILYRASQDEGWSDVLEVRLSDQINLKAAYEILERRVRNR